MVTRERLSIELSERTVVGRKVRSLRRTGVVPVHYYGHGIEPMTLQVEGATLRKIVAQAGANIPVAVSVEGTTESNICFIREVQRHPVTDTLLHVDFMRVDVTEKVTAEVPVVLVGEANAVRELGGVLIQPFQTLPVEALPLDMPETIEVDISSLNEFGDAVRMRDIAVQADITILRDEDDLLVTVQEPRIEEEPEIEEELLEGEEGVEGEEGAEGDGADAESNEG